MREYCVGCGKEHEDVKWTYHTYTDENDERKSGWFCHKTYQPARLKNWQQKKWRNMSPREVLGARDLGTTKSEVPWADE